MNTPNMQHLIPATAILLLAVAVAWLSFTQEPAGAYLFPRLISAVMLLLALWNFARAALGMARIGGGVTEQELLIILSGLSVAAILAFWAAKALGFYVAATGAFFLAMSFYDPSPHSQLSSWIKRLVVTIGFMAVIYLLFAKLLQVQTPRGMFM